MPFAGDIVSCSTIREQVETKLEDWRRAMEVRGLKISRKKSAYLGCNEHRYPFTGRDSKEREDIHISDTTFCIGWSIGYGSHNSVQSGWKNMARVSEVLCDSTMNVTIKKKVYGIEVSPA